MTRRAPLVLIPLLLVPLMTAGCVIVDEDPAEVPSARWTGPPPGPQQVRQAAAWLDDAIARRFKQTGWPAHLPRSRDFAKLPLVQLTPVQDLGAWGIDTDALTKTLEQSLREYFSLRFLADEVAVPDFLRDEQAPPEGKPPADASPPKDAQKPTAGLVLKAWAAEDGRFYLELRDVVKKTALVTIRSQQPGGF